MAQMLVVNSGSSSLRYDVFQVGTGRADEHDPTRLLSGNIERIGDNGDAADHGEVLGLVRRRLAEQD